LRDFSPPPKKNYLDFLDSAEERLTDDYHFLSKHAALKITSE
jgi:hypothetical protein